MLPTKFLVLVLLWAQLQPCRPLKKYELTAFPDKTHLRHGLAGSHPKCFFLQLTHAEATWAFVRLVAFCGKLWVANPGDEDVGNVGGGYDTSGGCERPCRPNEGGHREEGGGSLKVNGG